MAGHEEVWIPLVDEPIGSIVGEIQREHPEIEALVDSPRKLLAFRTFAYIRVGILLGRLLVENEVEPADDSTTWAEQLLLDPAASRGGRERGARGRAGDRRRPRLRQ